LRVCALGIVAAAAKTVSLSVMRAGCSVTMLGTTVVAGAGGKVSLVSGVAVVQTSGADQTAATIT
jgi:hypothetical protein